MKGQVSTEFIIVFAILMVLFLATFQTALRREAITEDMILALDAQKQADRLALYINSIHQAGPGSGAVLVLDETLEGVAYSLDVRASSRRAEATFEKGDNRTYSSPLLTSSVVFTSSDKELTIVNRNGTIYVE